MIGKSDRCVEKMVMGIYLYGNVRANLGIVAQVDDQVSGSISFDEDTIRRMIRKNEFLSNQYFLIRFREWKNKKKYPSDEEVLHMLFSEHIMGNELMIKHYMEAQSEKGT